MLNLTHMMMQKSKLRKGRDEGVASRELLLLPESVPLEGSQPTRKMRRSIQLRLVADSLSLNMCMVNSLRFIAPYRSGERLLRRQVGGRKSCWSCRTC